MPDYQKMYYVLCDAASKALDRLPESKEEAKKLLQDALNEAEDLYIETAE